MKYHCEISWYFSVHRLPQSLRNYKEEAKIKPSEKALAMPGQKHLPLRSISLPIPHCRTGGKVEHKYPISFLHTCSYFGIAVIKHYQDIPIPIFRLVVQKFALLSCISCICDILLFLLDFFWLGCYCCIWLYFSPGLVKF